MMEVEIDADILRHVRPLWQVLWPDAPQRPHSLRLSQGQVNCSVGFGGQTPPQPVPTPPLTLCHCYLCLVTALQQQQHRAPQACLYRFKNDLNPEHREFYLYFYQLCGWTNYLYCTFFFFPLQLKFEINSSKNTDC